MTVRCGALPGSTCSPSRTRAGRPVWRLTGCSAAIGHYPDAGGVVLPFASSEGGHNGVVDAERVRLVESRPVEWAQRFQVLAGELRELVGVEASIEHIGSTSVPDLPSKDVVDVLVGVAPGHIVSVSDCLAVGGFVLEGRGDGHVWLTRGASGRRVCVIHVVETDSRQWLRRIAFRDLLRRDADARVEYLQTKRAAVAEASNWNDYTQAKTETVHRLLRAGPT